MPITIRIAKSTEVKEEVYRLRYRVYSLEEGVFPKSEEEMVYDEFDQLPDTMNLLAFMDGTPVGTLRMVKDSDLGLPVEKMIDISSLRKNRQPEFGDTPLFNVGMLAIRKDFRNTIGLLGGMLKFALSLGKYYSIRDVVVTINYQIESMMRDHVGLKRIGETFRPKDIENFVVPMYGKMEEIERQFPIEMLPFGFTEFIEMFERRIYSRHEVVCRKGEPGEEAYVVMRGSINVFVEPKIRMAIIPPGEMIGEMALIDDELRSADLIANARETELMVLAKSSFSQVLGEISPAARSMLLCLCSRLRHANAAVSSIERQRGIAERLRHLLLSLHQFRLEGITAPLDVDWAAEEIGVETEEIRDLFSQLTSHKIIRANDLDLIVDEPALTIYDFTIDFNK
jgi:CRP-like cAMP-binding protein/N-acyl-L-homoserine lactone synthetase